MLEPTRERVRCLLAQVDSITLATSGGAGLQASAVRCEGVGVRLYLLVPRTSDHLVNLEDAGVAVVSSTSWQARGKAHLVPRADWPVDLTLISGPEARWSELVEFRPTRMEIGGREGWGYDETVDLD